MTVIRQPLSGGRGMEEVSLYADYADQARRDLDEGRFFETIAVCLIGLDVLLNTLPDRLLLFSSNKLDECQKRMLGETCGGTFTAGVILNRLDTAAVLDRRLLRALDDLSKARNKVFHPFQEGKLKSGAVYPSSATKERAESFFRKFCHVIDIAGGRSPRRQKKQLARYIMERQKTQKRKLIKR